jgi:hypothetical protein
MNFMRIFFHLQKSVQTFEVGNFVTNFVGNMRRGHISRDTAILQILGWEFQQVRRT